MVDQNLLKNLSKQYPDIRSATQEIVNLSAILSLPKGTEYYLSDLHGEHEAFIHMIKSASGVIAGKINEIFGPDLTIEEREGLASLVYNAEAEIARRKKSEENFDRWCRQSILHLVYVCKSVCNKYTQSKIRKRLPKDYAYIIDELLHADDEANMGNYYTQIINTMVECRVAEEFIIEMADVISSLAVDKLHIIGDIWDRGAHPDEIMDYLMEFDNIDFQWGNHDVVWMGAALGQRGCIAHVVRNCARYGNLSVLEDAYGINILPLASFALEAYKDDPCVAFGLKGDPQLAPHDLEMNVKIQKAMAIIQFKVEAKIIDENPSFALSDRKLLDKIDYEKGTVVVDGVEYELIDKVFPTIDPSDPFRLTPEEEEVMQRLEQAFIGSEKLQRHMRFFLDAGSLYKIANGNLLFHAGVPLNDDGSLMEVDVYGGKYKGRALYDVLDRYVRDAYNSASPIARKRGADMLWWLWLAPGSPLFAKSKMATFELYLIAEKEARKEVKNPFYTFLENEEVMAGIFRDFGLDPKTSRIVCGHVPVKVKDGEDPVKCGGKVLTIDGGFSKAYQKTTGIAGYTLISNSYGFVLAAHEPLESVETAVVDEVDIHSSRRVVEHLTQRILVADTDTGTELKEQIDDLEKLLEAYRQNLIAEG